MRRFWVLASLVVGLWVVVNAGFAAKNRADSAMAARGTAPARVFLPLVQNAATGATPPAETMAGVPEYPLDYAKDVESWWANHPYNPDSPNYVPVGSIESPQLIIDVKTQFGGDIQAAVDALPVTGGTLYFRAGTYDSFRVIAKNNVHFIGENQNTVFIRGGSIYGCPMSLSYSDLDYQLSQNNSEALDCLRNRYRNFYFRNITFDGQNRTVSTSNQTPINEALYFRAVKDVLMENIVVQNYGSPPNDDWSGGVCENCANIVSHAWVDNIFVRNSLFRAYALNAWYMDGSQGSGVINSLFESSWRSTALLNLVNNDFTEDLNRDGVLDLSEQRVPMYTVYYGNTFREYNYAAFTVQGARSLIKNNLYLAPVHRFAFFEVRSDLPEYQYLGNVTAGNFVEQSSLFVVNSGGTNANRQGQYKVRDNTVQRLGGLTPDEQGYDPFVQNLSTVIGPNVVENNCVAGRLNNGPVTCAVVLPDTPTPQPTSSVTPSPPPAVTPSPTLPPDSALIVGYQKVGSQTDVSDSNFMNGSRFITGAYGGTVTSVSVHVGAVGSAPNNRYEVALYRDSGGAPGTLLATSDTGTLIGNSWNTIAIGATLAPHTPFWIVYNTNGVSSGFNNLHYDGVAFAQSAFGTSGQTFGSWPENFGPASPQNIVFSLYATLSTGVAPTPTPAIPHGYFPLGVFEDSATLPDSARFGPVIADLKAHHLDSVMLNGLSTDAGNAFLSVSDGLNFQVLFPVGPDLNAQWWQSPAAATIENARTIIYPLVDSIKDHASLKGYYIVDEPSLDLSDKLALAVQAFRERDPSRPAFPILIGVDRVGPLFDASKPAAIVIDVYPVGYDNGLCDFTMTGFGYYDRDFVDYVREVVRTKPRSTPLWILLQAHKFGTGGVHSLRQPLPEEVRAEHWLAIGEGAHGIFWFIYGSQQGWVGLKDNPVLFAEISNLANRTAPLKDTLLQLHRTDNLFTVSGPTNSYVSTLTNADGSMHYAVAVNLGSCSQPADLSIRSSTLDGALRDLESGQIYSLGSAISFPPGDGRIFELIAGS